MHVTRGIQVLQQLQVEFEVVEYLYKQKGAGRAAEAVGWLEEQTIKSLVVQTGPKDHCFCLVPAHRELSLKKLARALGLKQVELADPRDAERLTGYVPGGISPFGSYTRMPVVLDESLLEHERVLINAGHRGVLVALDPWVLQELLEATVEDIIT